MLRFFVVVKREFLSYVNYNLFGLQHAHTQMINLMREKWSTESRASKRNANTAKQKPYAKKV